MITAERLKELLSYEPETGAFKWRVARKGVRLDHSAGRVNSLGYAQVKIDYHFYAAHRLAWLFVNGVWPDGHLDHINSDRSDNRIANLRLASAAENARNRLRPRTNRSGFKGVYRASTATWRAQIKVDGQQHVLGWFASPEEAHAAYRAAATQHFGAFANDGTR